MNMINWIIDANLKFEDIRVGCFMAVSFKKNQKKSDNDLTEEHKAINEGSRKQDKCDGINYR